MNYEEYQKKNNIDTSKPDKEFEDFEKAHPIMSQEALHKKIREICTYHSDDGTSGYSLSSEQFQQLFDLYEARTKEVKNRILGIFEEYENNTR